MDPSDRVRTSRSTGLTRFGSSDPRFRGSLRPANPSKDYGSKHLLIPDSLQVPSQSLCGCAKTGLIPACTQSIHLGIHLVFCQRKGHSDHLSHPGRNPPVPAVPMSWPAPGVGWLMDTPSSQLFGAINRHPDRVLV